MHNLFVVAAGGFVIAGENGVVLRAAKVVGQAALHKCPRHSRARLRTP